MAMAIELNAAIFKDTNGLNDLGIAYRILERKSVGKPLFGRQARDGRITL
jgi:hypothetical protein